MLNKSGIKSLGPLAFALCLAVGCAHNPATQSQTEAGKNDAIAQALKETKEEKTGTKTESQVTTEEKTASRSAQDIENLTIDEVIRIEEPNTQNLYDNSRYDFPITMNSRVEGWIDYFTGRGREHMERYLARSSRYIPIMRKSFKKAGLPEDLVYLALIESGFNLRAKSRARAVGPWQFMKPTGKRYGLRVDSWIDERRDPLRSTEAAANYLKDLYLMFESWYLAASAYNAGEYKILRAIENLKTNNYWRICETKQLRRETKDYIPKLIAAAIIGKNPARYGFQAVAYQEPLEFDTVALDFPMRLKDIGKMVDASEDDMSDLNPSFVHGMIPPNGSYEIRIPTGTKTLLEKAVANIRNNKGKYAADLPEQHTVRSGETLNSISKKYRVRSKDLANANNLGRREQPKPGTVLVIPGRKLAAMEPIEEAPKHAKRAVSNIPDNTPGFVIHIVKPGESLWSISEQYDVTVQNLFRWNNLHRSALHPGKRLKVKVSTNSTHSDGAVISARSKRNT